MKRIKGFKDGVYFHQWRDQQYSTNYWVVIAEDGIKDTSKFIKNLNKTDDLIIPDGSIAMCLERFIDNRQNVILLFSASAGAHIMVHESIHAKNFVFGYHGVSLSTEHDEHEAYFVDYIVKNIVEVFRLRDIELIKQEIKKNGSKRKVGKKRK